MRTRVGAVHDYPSRKGWPQSRTRSTGMLWPAAQVALRQAQLNGVPDESGRIRFLESTTGEKSAAAWWAVQVPCDQGRQEALPFIRDHIRRVYSLTRDVEQAITFCEA